MEFDNKLQAGVISEDAATLINSMFMIIDIMLAIFMERTTKKNNKNSSKPSSQTEKDQSSKEGAKSKGKEEKDEMAPNSRTVESVERIKLEFCENCGASLLVLLSTTAGLLIYLIRIASMHCVVLLYYVSWPLSSRCMIITGLRI